MMIVSYDFSNDKVRAKFSRFLGKYGRRLQYSVFEIKNSRRVLDIIRTEVEKSYQKLFTNADSVYIFGTCKGCDNKILRYGYAKHEESDTVFM